MRLGLAALLATIALCACDSQKPELAAPPKVTNFALQSKLMGRQLYEELVTPAGGGRDACSSSSCTATAPRPATRSARRS
jgi:hypothetical protein